jgi:ribonuclease P protein component
VGRNRAKRRLREAYRAARHDAPDHVDIMLIAKRGALDGAFGLLREHVREVLVTIPGVRGGP